MYSSVVGGLVCLPEVVVAKSCGGGEGGGEVDGEGWGGNGGGDEGGELVGKEWELGEET